MLATNYEVGIKGAIGEGNRYELSLFRISVEDELIPFELASQPGRDFFANAGESSREGAEIALISEPVDGLTVSLAYTYSDFDFERFMDDNGNDFSGNTIPGIPENLFRTEAAYSHSTGFYAAVELLHVGSFFVNNANSEVNRSYRVVHLRAGLQDLKWGKYSISPFLGVNNLTDEGYAANVRINAFGGRFFEPAPERHFYGGVTIHFNSGQSQ